jgi:hypothetical protein
MTVFSPAQPVSIAALEDGVMARLVTKITPNMAGVDAFPADPKTYRMVHPRGELLVAYASASHGEIGAGDSDTQRTFALDVVVIGRGLNKLGHRYATDLLEAALACLAGFVVPGFDPLIPVREEFIGVAEAAWIFNVRFQATTMFVAGADDDVLGPLLQRITLEEPDLVDFPADDSGDPIEVAGDFFGLRIFGRTYFGKRYFG